MYHRGSNVDRDSGYFTYISGYGYKTFVKGFGTGDICWDGQG